VPADGGPWRVPGDQDLGELLGGRARPALRPAPPARPAPGTGVGRDQLPGLKAVVQAEVAHGPPGGSAVHGDDVELHRLQDGERLLLLGRGDQVRLIDQPSGLERLLRHHATALPAAWSPSHRSSGGCLTSIATASANHPTSARYSSLRRPAAAHALAITDDASPLLYARPEIIRGQQCTAGAACSTDADRTDDAEGVGLDLPAICQQQGFTTPHAAPCRFIAICVLSSTDMRQRVDAC